MSPTELRRRVNDRADRSASDFPILAAVLSLAVWLSSAVVVRAAGDEYSAAHDDIRISADWRWAGGQAGGYHPIRISLRNAGPARELTVRFESNRSGGDLPDVSRTVRVEQNANVRFTLLVPLVSESGYGILKVIGPHGEIEELSHGVSLPDADLLNARPGILLISDDVLDLAPLERAFTSVLGVSGRSPYYRATADENHERVSPALLPETWLAYSGLDLVMLSWPVVSRMPDESRTALLDWVRSGGTLLVHSVGEPVAASADLARVTGLDRQTARTEWRKPALEQRVAADLVDINEYGNVSRSTEASPQWTWPAEVDAFAVRAFGSGRLVAFRDSPFPGTIHDWKWMITTLGRSGGELRFGKRLGVHCRTNNDEFLHFLIPGIRSVPVVSFLIFISAFAFVIGPLNYFMLSRRGRLNLLIITIPAIAFLTSTALFAYSAVANGFSVRARVRSLTEIDQGSQIAVAQSRLSLYAGLAPSDGLRFSPSTAVLPVWPTESGFESGSVNWTETQALESGWLRSRTRTQFLTITVRPERGRLEVRPASDASAGLPVTNGLEWDLAELLISSPDGRVFAMRDLQAGAAANLPVATQADFDRFLEYFEKSRPGIPDEIMQVGDVSLFDSFRPRRYWYWGGQEPFRVSEGQMEQRIESLRLSVRERDRFPPRTWLAVTRQSPALELGTTVEIVDGWHLLHGSY